MLPFKFINSFKPSFASFFIVTGKVFSYQKEPLKKNKEALKKKEEENLFRKTREGNCMFLSCH